VTTQGRKNGWLARRTTEWNDRVTSRLHAEVLRGPGGAVPAGRSRGLAVLLAVMVDASTLALAALGVWIAVVTPFRVGGIVVGLVLVLVAWDVRPRLARRPEGGSHAQVVRAPAFESYLHEVADAVGTRPVDEVYVNHHVNASVFDVGLRRRRVLVVGAPLWAALTTGQRTALLGHELAHFVSGDTRHSTVVGGALTTLAEWHQVMRDDRTVGLVPPPRGLLIGFSNWVARWFMRVLSIVPRGLSLILLVVTLQDSRRAEYRADRVSAQVAGRDDAVGLLRMSQRTDSLVLALRRATAGREPDLLAVAAGFAGTTSQAPPRTTPPGLLDSHPPDHLRLEAVQHLPPSAGSVLLSPERAAAIDAELAPAFTKAERRLRDAFR